MIRLTDKLEFPAISLADDQGFLAFGGDLSSERLLLAYNSGIFPWYDDGQPILWWSPNPRMVLYLSKFKISKSLRKTIRANKFKVTFNTCFSEVIENCSKIKRTGQNGTWISKEMKDAYLELNKKGIAFSVEVWFKEQLVGGLYGVDLKEKKVFCGESMFTKMSDSSKVGFYHLVKRLEAESYKIIDCQVYTDHLKSLGAEEIERSTFLSYLDN